MYKRQLYVLVWELDGTSYPYAEEVASRLRAHIRVLPEAGHYLWIDAPEAFEEAFKDALAALVPALRGPLVD